MLANWPKPADIATPSPAVFPVVNFLFQFCPPNPSETALLERFAKLNIGPGQTFDFSKFSPEIQRAISDGIKDSNSEVSAVMQKVNNDQVSCSDFFGTRDFLKDNYLYRYVGAKLGLYGNTGSDAIYFGYFVDANHQPLDASRSSYELRFTKGELPPSRVFWSVTMYDGKTQLLIANPLKRYLLNSTTGTPGPKTLEDLSGQVVWVNPFSVAKQALASLNESLKKAGKPEVTIRAEPYRG